MRATVVVLVLVSVAPAAFAALPATQTQRYVAAGGDVAVDCALNVNVGGACFYVDGTENRIQLTILDDQFARVGGYWSFRDGPDSTLSDEITGGRFCHAASVPVPFGAVVLHVYVDQALSPLDCPDVGAGTTGYVRAEFG